MLDAFVAFVCIWAGLVLTSTAYGTPFEVAIPAASVITACLWLCWVIGTAVARFPRVPMRWRKK